MNVFILLSVPGDSPSESVSRPSVHKQIRPPALVVGGEVSLNKRDMRRPGRFLDKRHAGVFRRAVTLVIVAADTGTNHVFPGVAAVKFPRDDVVDSH